MHQHPIEEHRGAVYRLAPWIFFGLAYLTAVLFIYFRADYLVNSDDSSELVLGRLLSDEGSIITPNWFYSTELRVLNIAQVFAVVFHFLSDWHMVRVVGSAIMYAIMSASCFFFCRSIRTLRTAAPLYMTFLLLPFSYEAWNVILRGLYYTVHISTAFLTIGLVMRYRERRKSPKWGGFLLLLLFLLSIGTGLGGPRMLAMLYLPLLMTALAVSGVERTLLFPSAVAMLGGGIGYIGNLILLHSGRYHYMDFSEMRFRLQGMKRASWLAEDVFSVLGASAESGRAAMLFGILTSLLLVSLFLLVFLRTLRSKDLEGRLLAWLALSMTGVLIAISMLTDFGYDRRYFLPVAVMYLPPILAYRREHPEQRMLRFGCGLALIALCGAASFRYLHYAGVDENEERRLVADTLVEMGYTQGYASFWNSNILTELSDGVIEMWTLQIIDTTESGQSENSDGEQVILGIRPWLQYTGHAGEAPNGRNFMLLDREEYQLLIRSNPQLTEAYVGETQGYVIYLDLRIN